MITPPMLHLIRTHSNILIDATSRHKVALILRSMRRRDAEMSDQ